MVVDSVSMNLYKLLGVDSAADDGTIKRAYRKLAMDLHPDRNPGSDVKLRKFQEVTAAYAILSDPKARAAYDKTLPGIGGAPGARESLFGPLFDELVSRVQREGIGSDNIDEFVDDLLGVAKDVKHRFPQKVAQAVRSPGSLMDVLQDMVGGKIKFGTDKKS